MDQTQFSPKKKDPRKRKTGLLLSVYSLSAITQTENQKNEQYGLLIIDKLQVYI